MCVRVHACILAVCVSMSVCLFAHAHVWWISEQTYKHYPYLKKPDWGFEIHKVLITDPSLTGIKSDSSVGKVISVYYT